MSTPPQIDAAYALLGLDQSPLLRRITRIVEHLYPDDLEKLTSKYTTISSERATLKACADDIVAGLATCPNELVTFARAGKVSLLDFYDSDVFNRDLQKYFLNVTHDKMAGGTHDFILKDVRTIANEDAAILRGDMSYFFIREIYIIIAIVEKTNCFEKFAALRPSESLIDRLGLEIRNNPSSSETFDGLVNDVLNRAVAGRFGINSEPA